MCVLLNSVGYKSIGIPYLSIARVAVLLVWTFSFPNKQWPQSLSQCEKVFGGDVECIIKIVKELFPMKRDCCEFVYSMLLHKKGSSNSSPTSTAVI